MSTPPIKPSGPVPENSIPNSDVVAPAVLSGEAKAERYTSQQRLSQDIQTFQRTLAGKAPDVEIEKNDKGIKPQISDALEPAKVSEDIPSGPAFVQQNLAIKNDPERARTTSRENAGISPKQPQPEAKSRAEPSSPSHDSDTVSPVVTMAGKNEDSRIQHRDGMSLSEVNVLVDDDISVTQHTLMPTTDNLLRAQIDRANTSLTSDTGLMFKAPLAAVDDIQSIDLVKETIHAQLNIKSRDNAKIDVEIQNNELKVSVQASAESGKSFDAGALIDLRTSLEQKYPHMQVHVGIHTDNTDIRQMESDSTQQDKRDRQDAQGDDSEQQREPEDNIDEAIDEYLIS